MSVRVLIADSDRYLLGCYREYFLQQGFEVATATNGLECLQQLREFVPDVLVLVPEISWGGGDGVLTLMHEDDDVPLVPVIVLTYGRDIVKLYNIAPLGIDDYQKKPLAANRLAERIRLVLGKQHSCPVAARQSG